ncbi:MAG: iron ABC transporter permease [Rikenellaceae bacterium]|jgi:iron complex transport system permease protein|nr:iron ABC transporter permease [Rikenellaceae bacterium]
MRLRRLYFPLLTLLILLLLALDVAMGTADLSLADVWRAVTGKLDDPTMQAIVMRFRIPKALVALLAGAALSAAGLQMQTLFRNPLSGPYVLGISSGASLGVALFLMGLPLLGAGVATDALRNVGMVGAAWIGGALILVAVMAVSARIKDIMAVLILGMMFGSAASALVEIMQYFSPEGNVKSFVVWTMGNLGGISVPQLRIMAPVVLLGLALAVFLIKPLNILLLGENYARTMGVNVRRVRLLLFASTTLLAGTITAFCGPIGFLGIAVPHLCRMLLLQADHRVLMPASMLMGAAVMLSCDILSQVPGTDATLPINTVTALMGIPVVVIVIMRNRRFF